MKLLNYVRKNATTLLRCAGVIFCCGFLALLLGPKSDYLIFFNLMLGTVFLRFLYRILYRRESIVNPVKELSVIVLFFIFGNHMYSASRLKQIFPFLFKFDGYLLYALIISVFATILFSVKLINEFRKKISLSMVENASRTAHNISENAEVAKYLVNKSQSATYKLRNAKGVASGKRNFKEATEKEPVSKNKLTIKSFMYGFVITIILAMVTAAAIYCTVLLFSNNGSFENIDVFGVIATGTSFGISALVILLIFFAIAGFTVDMVRFLISRIAMLRTPTTENKAEESTLNPLNVSIALYFIFLYFSQKLGAFSLDNLYDMVTLGTYFALPLTLLLLLITFLIYALIVKSAMVFLSSRDKSSINKEIKEISTTTANIILNAIKNTLKFVEFIPDIFSYLYFLIFGDEDNEDYEVAERDGEAESKKNEATNKPSLDCMDCTAVKKEEVV